MVQAGNKLSASCHEFSVERRIRIVKGYAREFEKAMVMKKGSSLQVIRRNDVMEMDGKYATFLMDYDSKELTVSEGDVLISIYGMGGWTRARKPSGEEGWIPDEIAEPYYSL